MDAGNESRGSRASKFKILLSDLWQWEVGISIKLCHVSLI